MIYNTPSQPRQIRLDTTTECNASCLSCHRYYTKRRGTMELSMAKSIIDDIARWKTPLTELVPVNYGEFLKYEKWAELLDYCQNKLPETRIVLPTNGGLLSDRIVEFLASIKTLKLINFSVNAMFKETYESFMHLDYGVTDLIKRSINRLHDLNPVITIWISIVADPIYQTQNELDVFKAYWSRFGAVQVLPNVTCGRPNKKVMIKNYQPCRSIFSDMAIGYDGKLTACCFDAGFTMDLGEYTGDAKKDWFNPQLNEMREIHNKGKRQEIKKCEECSHA